MSEDRVRVLYVDDEAGNRVVFEQSFKAQFDIKTVSSGEAALALIRQDPQIGVVITDQRMPGMGGNDLLSILKQERPELLRIIITAYGDLDPILKAVNDGLVARYILKPWDRKELETVLTWAVETFGMGRVNQAVQLRLLETERLATLGTMHGALLHDLAQPLSFLLGNAEALSNLAPVAAPLLELVKKYGDDLDNKQLEQATYLLEDLEPMSKDMLTAALLIKGLISNVRSILKPHLKAADQVCEPRRSIDFVVSACRQPVLDGGGVLTYDGPEQLPHVSFSTTELSQVLLNLVNNAAQGLQRKKEARKQPGVSADRVTLAARVQGQFVQLAIVDTGPGMSAEVLSKIGTPFYTTRTDGTGLGVNQCRRIIEKYGGTLRFDSVEGQGTTVTVQLLRSSR